MNPVATNAIPLKTYFNKEDLQKLTFKTLEWVKTAGILKVDISNQLKNLAFSMSDITPAIENPRNGHEEEVILIQQIFIRRIYCNQIIRKIIKESIKSAITFAKERSKNLSVINFYELSLEQYIPRKISLDPVSINEKLFASARATIQNLVGHLESGKDLTVIHHHISE